MKESLNIKKLKDACTKLGLNQAAISRELGVSRTIVSSWFKNEKYPRPKVLLKLGRLLKLQYEDLVKTVDDMTEPVVAYRSKTNRKTRNVHYEKARSLGKYLEKLAQAVPSDEYLERKTLVNPAYNYEYAQKLASRVRKDVGVKSLEKITFLNIIEKLIDLNAILIPVFWGHQDQHGNALGIYLPESNTTWVYLNIDAKVHDFKFWMAHELAHILTDFDTSKEAEAFADLFAQCLLFPEPAVEEAYLKIKNLRQQASINRAIFEFAEENTISPYTVIKALDSYSTEYEKKKIKVAQSFFGWMTKKNKQSESISDILSGGKEISPKAYIKFTKEEFQSPFFEYLERYIEIEEYEIQAGFLQNILDISYLDSKSILHEF